MQYTYDSGGDVVVWPVGDATGCDGASASFVLGERGHPDSRSSPAAAPPSSIHGARAASTEPAPPPSSIWSQPPSSSIGSHAMAAAELMGAAGGRVRGRRRNLWELMAAEKVGGGARGRAGGSEADGGAAGRVELRPPAPSRFLRVLGSGTGVTGEQ